MPELKDIPSDEWEDADVDVWHFFNILPFLCSEPSFQWSSYSYADKKREAQRIASQSKVTVQEAQEKARSEKEKRSEQKKKNAAWSLKVEQRDRRDLRKEKKDRKRAWLKEQDSKVVSDEASGTKRALQSDDEDNDDWDELAKEERMAKKLRKGTINRKQFDEEFSGL